MPIANGSDHFTTNGIEIEITVSDFWIWAYSDLANSNVRSSLAEYIVASSLKLAYAPAPNCGYRKLPYDLQTADGYTIDVESAAYIQSEDASRPDCVSFPIINTASDATIFCIYKGMMADNLHTNLDLWEFYVIKTEVLTSKKPNLKTITLPSLMQLEPLWCDYYGIGIAVHTVINA